MKKFLLATGALALVVLVAIALVPRPAASAGTASKPAQVRPSLPGKFVWFDLLTNDAAAAEKYYGGLFGWTFEVLKGHEPPYKIIREKGHPIGGLVDMTLRKDGPAGVHVARVRLGARRRRGGRRLQGEGRQRSQGAVRRRGARARGGRHRPAAARCSA